MNYVTIATLLHITAYLFYTGVIPSISDSYRTVKDVRVYHAFFLVFAALIAAQGLYCPDRLQIPYVIAGFFVFGLSMASEFWKKEQGLWHVVFTYTAIIIGLTLTLFWVWPTWKVFSLLLPAGLIGGGVILQEVKNATYWQEVLAVIVIFGPITYI